MLPMIALRLSLGTDLAADATNLAPAMTANKIALIMEDFAPAETLVAGDLTLANFTGSAGISGAVGAQLTGIDPVTGQQIITIKTPLGGYRWVTTDAVNLPQTIFGFALLKSDLTVLYAVQHLDNPIVLAGAGQEVDLGSVFITLVLQPMS